MARQSEPFPDGILLGLEDIACEELRNLVELAGLSGREAQVWLTHQLSQIAPYAVEAAFEKPLTQVAIAEILGCSKQYVNKLFQRARRKISAVTGGCGYVVAGGSRVCPEEVPVDPLQMERWAGRVAGSLL